MRYSRHRKALERMYGDSASISRSTGVDNPDSGKTKLTPQLVYGNQPCRISQKALASNDQTEAQNEIRYETKLFIAPELDIRQGDEIVVTRGTVIRTYEAGEPFLYSTHQEISLQRRIRA